MDIGIMGSGQLGWMMILEGRKLDNRYFVLDKDRGGPASEINVMLSHMNLSTFHRRL